MNKTLITIGAFILGAVITTSTFAADEQWITLIDGKMEHVRNNAQQ